MQNNIIAVIGLNPALQKTLTFDVDGLVIDKVNRA